MSLDILIHKNSYSKTHVSFIYGLIKNVEKHHVVSVHDKLYDLFYIFSPKTIFLQLEEYTNEWHFFINDPSIKNKPKVFVTIDDDEYKKEQYIKLLTQIKESKCVFIAPQKFIKDLPKAQYIEYEYLYNSDIYFPLNQERNDKTLTILSNDPKCISDVEPYLYPNKEEKLCLVNNPSINNEQNVGLMFDHDMNTGLNTFGSVIDLSRSYDAEIVVCETPISKINKNTYPSKEQTVTIDTFLKQHIL